MDDVRARLEARISNSWKRVDVPDSWLPHLAELDAAIAEIDPEYSAAQIKIKFSGLRFYVAQAGSTPDDARLILDLIRAAEDESFTWE